MRRTQGSLIEQLIHGATDSEAMVNSVAPGSSPQLYSLPPEDVAVCEAPDPPAREGGDDADECRNKNIHAALTCASGLMGATLAATGAGLVLVAIQGAACGLAVSQALDCGSKP